VSAGIIIWAATTIEEDADRVIAQVLGAFALVALASSGWWAYSAYRRPSSRVATLATGLAVSVTALALFAWFWTIAGVAWCSSHPCGD
jgi:hypothetical protein